MPLLELLKNIFLTTPKIKQFFWFPVTRIDAKNHLEVFLSDRFSQFGTYEDAMVENTNFLFHSCISPLLNLGLLTPNMLSKELLIYQISCQFL